MGVQNAILTGSMGRNGEEEGCSSSWSGHYTLSANQPAFYNQYYGSGYMQPFCPSAASFQPIAHPSFRPYPLRVNSVNSVNDQAFHIRVPPRIPLGERSKISHAAASDEVEVKIQRRMAVLTEDRFIEEEVQRRLAKKMNQSSRDMHPMQTNLPMPNLR